MVDLFSHVILCFYTTLDPPKMHHEPPPELSVYTTSLLMMMMDNNSVGTPTTRVSHFKYLGVKILDFICKLITFKLPPSYPQSSLQAFISSLNLISKVLLTMDIATSAF